MLEIKITMQRFYLFLGLTILLALNSCAMVPPLLKDTATQPGGIDDEQLRNYGAVYEFDEFRIKTELFNPNNGWSTYFYVNRMMRVLNRKGVDYGTIYVHQHTTNLTDFKVKLWDPAGKAVPLDLEAMKQKYVETGKIIVPRVEPNCRIGINLVFRKDGLAYYWEHWFERKIPVLKGRFSILYPGEIEYNCKTYGGVTHVKKRRYGAHIGYILDHENILPEDDVFEKRWHIDREPHIMARIRHWSWYRFSYDAPDWSGLARHYYNYFMSPSIFTSKSTVKKTASEIMLNKNGDFEKADAILAYVQDNITLDINKEPNLDSVDLNHVLRNKSGGWWDIAVLLKELLEAGGFSTQVYVTQPHHVGGFDPDFPSWNFLYIPLISVKINGGQLIGWPYNRFMGLGEYPFSYHDLHALSLDGGKVLPLPASIHKTATQTSLATLSTGNWESPHKWKFIYRGYYASHIRAKMGERTPEKRKTYFKSLIRDYDKENSLEHADLETINRQGEIEVNLECQEAGSKTEGPKESHYSLRPWFRKYFVDYDNSRKANYTNDMVLVFKDSVLVKGNDDRQRSCHFECSNLDNPLFSTICEKKQTNEGLLLSRKLTIKQADLTPGQMQNIQPDIVSLNRIDESFLVEKR
jgi:hypothetical protein